MKNTYEELKKLSLERDIKVLPSLNRTSIPVTQHLPMGRFQKVTVDYLENINSTVCPLCDLGHPITLKVIKNKGGGFI